MDLLHRLEEHRDSGAYPLHMPGHKRNTSRFGMPDPVGLDITEIDGFDDLHEPEGILREGMERAARVWGSEEAWYLVNGSTAGILAGICGCTRPGDRVLVSRSCHKSVYHAMLLNRLEPVYLMPEPVPGWPLMGSISPEKVEEILSGEAEKYGRGAGKTCPPEDRRRSGISLVVITSPTYEGILSDIPAIAEVCHRHGVPLLVDEAHGAHLGFGTFPAGAVAGGADLVVQSLHKTLPAFTQTGLLHRQGNLVSGRQVKKALDIFQSSSPSYILMAGIDRCVRMMEEERSGAGEETGKDNGTGKKTKETGRQQEKNNDGRKNIIDTAGWLEMLEDFYRDTGDLRVLEVLRVPQRRQGMMSGQDLQEFRQGQQSWQPQREFRPLWKDPSKLVIRTGAGHTGPELMELLRRRYGFELEMASTEYVIAMTGAGDRPEELRRFTTALREIDSEWAGQEERRERAAGERNRDVIERRPAADGRNRDAIEWKPAADGRSRDVIERKPAADGRNRNAGEQRIAEEDNRSMSVPAMEELLRRWRPKPVIPLAEAGDLPGEAVAISPEAAGRISLEFAYIYPPGIPVLAPGEEITPEVMEILDSCRSAGLPLRGLSETGRILCASYTGIKR